MPVVLMKYGSGLAVTYDLTDLCNNIPRIVAEALDVPEDKNARLTEKDIELWFIPTGQYERNTKHFSLLIFAHGYPARMVDLEHRKDKIIKNLLQFVPLVDKSGWVWIITGETAFGKL